MKSGVENRLAALQEFFRTTRRFKGGTRFLLTDGSEFWTQLDPVDYIHIFGAFSQDGIRIASFPHPAEGIDGLSMSFYEFVDEAIERGSIEWPQL